jgi:hypothetical protein
MAVATLKLITMRQQISPKMFNSTSPWVKEMTGEKNALLKRLVAIGWWPNRYDFFFGKRQLTSLLVGYH